MPFFKPKTKRVKEPRFRNIDRDKRRPPKELGNGELLLYASRTILRAAYLIQEEYGTKHCRQMRRLAGELAERGNGILHPKKPRVKLSQMSAPLTLLRRLQDEPPAGNGSSGSGPTTR